MTINLDHPVINYCSQCGSKMGEGLNELLSAEGKHICSKCNAIHRNDPKIVVLNLTEFNKKILLCKRAIKPRLGYWTLPGGYMENNETVEEAAMRETLEETGVKVDSVRLYALFNCPSINQVYFVYRSKVNSDVAHATVESSEARFFAECDIPWDRLSYMPIKQVLDWYFQDKMEDRYLFRTFDTYEACPDINA